VPTSKAHNTNMPSGASLLQTATPNNALQRTASQLGVRVCGSATAAGAAPVTPPATTCAPAGAAPRTAPACSRSVPAGAGSQRRSLSLRALGAARTSR
jgi:hypothetical protein